MTIIEALAQIQKLIALDVEAAAVPHIPVKTSNLQNSFGVKPDGDHLTAEMTWYGRFVLQGTGIYGPNKAPFVIVPKEKQALNTPFGVFKKVVVQGMAGRDFIAEGIEELQRNNEIQQTVIRLLEQVEWNA